MYQEDAEYYDHQRQLVQNEYEKRRDTGFVTDTSLYPWIEEGDDPVTLSEFETYSPREPLIREIQSYCADIHEKHSGNWTEEDGAHIAAILNRSGDPWGLFQFMDERTGDSLVGYRTRDGREWFYILRQMRNTVGSGLFENMEPRYQ